MMEESSDEDEEGPSETGTDDDEEGGKQKADAV
jgi:hypothetical protein